MGEALLDFMLAYPNQPYPSAAEYLIDTFGKSPNIEELITELQSRIESLKEVDTSEGKAEHMRLAARGGSGRFGGGQKSVVYGLGERTGLLQVLKVTC
jgi:ABC-type enterochelin transport system substrate-binding protein